jgi:hypothetical protein
MSVVFYKPQLIEKVITSLNPPAQSDMALWLRGDSLVDAGGGIIGSWQDKTGNGYHFSPASVNTDDLLINTLTSFNNRLAAGIDATKGTLKYQESTGQFNLADAQTNGMCIVLVHSHNTVASSGTTYFYTEGEFFDNKLSVGYNTSSQHKILFNDGSWTETAFDHAHGSDDVLFKVYNFEPSGTLNIYVNGTHTGTTWNTSVAYKFLLSQNSLFGASGWDLAGGPSEWWKTFNCAEFIVYNRSLTGGELSDLNQYFTDYYNM